MSEELLKKIAELEAQLKQKDEQLVKVVQKNKQLEKDCEPSSPIKKKLSNKKQIEDYLFLYDLFLDILGVSSWSELKNLYGRDEHRKIGIVLDNIKHFSKEQLEEIVEKVNEYDGSRKAD